MADRPSTPLILGQTRVVAPPLCPELQLHLADAVVPLWEAAEAWAKARLGPPYWGFAWAGGQALARWVLDHPELIRGKRVLDFASGCGVSAIAAARAGAGHVLATEIDGLAVDATRLNAALNQVAVEAAERDVLDADEGWEVVLTADIFYRAEFAERLERWLRRLAARGATVLIGDAARTFVPRHGLEALTRFEVPTSRDLEGTSSREATVWRLLPE